MNKLILALCLIASPAYAECRVMPYFSPCGGAEEAIIKEIREAKKSIYVAAYQFTAQPIALELEAAKKRGVDVKAVIDGKQIKQTYKSLGVLGFPVRFNKNYAIFHHKFLAIDDDTVLLGSYNFTKSAEVRNAENLNIIKDCGIGPIYKDQWLRYWSEAK